MSVRKVRDRSVAGDKDEFEHRMSKSSIKDRKYANKDKIIGCRSLYVYI